MSVVTLGLPLLAFMAASCLTPEQADILVAVAAFVNAVGAIAAVIAVVAVVVGTVVGFILVSIYWVVLAIAFANVAVVKMFKGR